ncbi:MAG: hypothetical protein M3R21_08200 [Candidatus Dormibacteraeota bacterium]|nr:hypothetical protein [Candidatus Dormibacteraeota bacterium]
MDQLLGELQIVLVKLTELADALSPFAHPKVVVVALLNDSLGLVLNVWTRFILSTTNFETGREFISNSTIQRYEPWVQILANAALVLVAVWGSYRIMWGHGLRSQYSARILLPRLLMGVLLINFSLPLLQIMVEASNTVCHALQSFATIDDPKSWWSNFANNPNAGTWEIVTTAALALGYDVLAIAYLMRYAILIVLAITAPLAGLLFMLPETHHMSKMWASQFMTNLLMQPAQLFVLSVGFALEKDGVTPVHHLFALASLLIVFKVPGALGGSSKVAHKLESTIASSLHHIEHSLVKV